MGVIHEWYGYLASDSSSTAAASAASEQCPFLGSACTKPGGVCSVEPSPGVLSAVCPNRLYFDDHRLLREIAALAFGPHNPVLNSQGLPELAPGTSARESALAARRPYVGVFGRGWGGEIKLPPAYPDGPRYAVDFLLVLVDSGGALAGIVPVEVQTIDTTGSYRPSVLALQSGRAVVPSTFGMNWENVNKRILPQLIVKGLMLQGERLCAHGIFFLTPEPVFDKIVQRLGGLHRFRQIPRQPGSITFIRMAYGPPPGPGIPAVMTQQPLVTISTSDLSLGFITPENLPVAGSYEAIVNAKL